MACRGDVLIALHGNTLPEPCVVALGKYESIHRGHRAGIERAVQLAKTKQVKSAVVAFSPHPHTLLQGTSYSPLFTQAERIFLLEKLGIDYLLEYPFDATLMHMSAMQFCTVLFTDLQAEAVIVGEDFRFGHGRLGTLSLLREEAAKNNRIVEATPPLLSNANPISTSAIRALLGEQNTKNTPDLLQATSLLSFPFFAMGTVTQGRQLGRTMGFPTLNLYPTTDKYLPPFGVYATKTTINGTQYDSITNIGRRPTVNKVDVAPTIETHIIKKTPAQGVLHDLYGTEIQVDFIHFIRAEMKFDGLDSLKAQIAKDVAHVKEFYTTTSASISIP